MSSKDSGKIFIEMEEELHRLPGVINIQIARDKQGKLLFIHLLIHQLDDRQKQELLERVIECGRKSGINIFEGQVTLALLGRTQALDQNDEVRAAIDGISVRKEKNMIEAEVRLKYRGIKYTGRHRGVDRNPLRMRVVGEATLNALQEILPPEFNLILISIRKVIIEEAEALVALLVVINAGRELRFVGTALNESGDEIQAVVKTVLAALNRFLASILFM